MCTGSKNLPFREVMAQPVLIEANFATEVKKAPDIVEMQHLLLIPFQAYIIL